MVLIFVWVDPASAFSISFIESTNETTNVSVTTVGLTTVIRFPPPTAESATVSGNLPGVSNTEPILALIGLTEPGTGLLSDIVVVAISPTVGGVTAISATFVSDLETALPPPMLALTALIPETGLEQVVFFRSFGGSGDLTVTAQSDFTPVPEPSMGILVGTMGLLGMGGALWRRSRRS
jgi:hypothetical protein